MSENESQQEIRLKAEKRFGSCRAAELTESLDRMAAELSDVRSQPVSIEDAP